jgi:hypothetical protein
MPAVNIINHVSIGHTPIYYGTSGRILFQGADNRFAQDSNLFWDNSNDRLGVGTSTPSVALDVIGKIKATAFQSIPVTPSLEVLYLMPLIY